MVVRWSALLLTLLFVVPAAAQESQLHADLRREGGDVHESCGGFSVKELAGCVITLATDDPVHVAFGSIAPQNGTAFGIGFAEHYTPNERWRVSWNADAVAAPAGSYRAGLYMKVIRTPTLSSGGIVVRRPGDPAPPARPAAVTIREFPVLNVYAQTISLDTLTVAGGADPFSEKQTIVGTSVVYPLGMRATAALRPSLAGSVNGRFVTTDGASASLTQQASFAEFAEGVRLRPSAFDDRLALNYLATFQQFAASADTNASFHRWTLDLNHRWSLYRTVPSGGPSETNGPDECFQSVGSAGCPPVVYSRNAEGSIGFRALATESMGNGSNRVPFYFQPTLGGSDLNGQRLLSAFDDYRFRGANLFAFQESIEYSIWGPIGVYALVEQGSVAAEGAGLALSDLSRSYGLGVTVRAGGFPLINLTFAWGREGHHIIGTIDPSLLGGSGRPSLF